jgi:hypothetical protein
MIKGFLFAIDHSLKAEFKAGYVKIDQKSEFILS